MHKVGDSGTGNEMAEPEAFLKIKIHSFFTISNLHNKDTLCLSTKIKTHNLRQNC